MDSRNTDVGFGSEDESVKGVLDPDGEEDFSRVTAVVSQWTQDFMFVSLCRYFKQGKRDEFSNTLAILDAMSPKEDDDKAIICAFIARVMYGKELDVEFEENANVMPLMSAARIWSNFKDKVADKNMHKNISILLLVQSVAVCMEKGQMSSASAALKWFESSLGFPQRNVGVILSKIVTKRDPYHPFLVNNSFSRLLEAIHSYLDAYLKENPSDYLLKAATKVVQSSPMPEVMEDEVTLESSVPEPAEESTVVKKLKRTLMSAKITDVWNPSPCKKPGRDGQKASDSPGSGKTLQESSLPPAELCPKPKNTKTAETAVVQKRSRQRQKWTYQLDQYLKNGVKRYGLGKWALILNNYDFEGRTSVMLKDRWRTLMKAHKVS